MNMIELRSSQIQSAGHDPDMNTLFVKFHKGGTYQYRNVPASRWADMLKSDSVGKWFSANIKDNESHPCSKCGDQSE